MNRREGVTVGFGEPTFQMREVLRSLGLEVAGPSNQYEDHLGLELLCLSEMCRRRAWALDMTQTAREVEVREAAQGEKDSADAVTSVLSDDEVAAFIDAASFGLDRSPGGKGAGCAPRRLLRPLARPGPCAAGLSPRSAGVGGCSGR